MTFFLLYIHKIVLHSLYSLTFADNFSVVIDKLSTSMTNSVVLFFSFTYHLLLSILPLSFQFQNVNKLFLIVCVSSLGCSNNLFYC